MPPLLAEIGLVTDVSVKLVNVSPSTVEMVLPRVSAVEPSVIAVAKFVSNSLRRIGVVAVAKI